MRQTIAFNNTAKYWKTSYSYTPSCMMHINKLFFTSPMHKIENDQNRMIWRHNDSSIFSSGGAYNSFFNLGHNAVSALAVSFNGYTKTKASTGNSTSSNKLFKSFSIEGNNQSLTLGSSMFIVNNNSTLGNLVDNHRFTPLLRKGHAVYGEIGKERAMTGTNIKAIGKISNVYRWQAFSEDLQTNLWRLLTDGGEDSDPVPIPGLHVDSDGLDVSPTITFNIDIPSNIHLYAFEIERFMSNNPIPASRTNAPNPGQYVKFFSGRVTEDEDMVSTPYYTLNPDPENPYTPNTGEYQYNFTEAFDFLGVQNYDFFLSYGDPYSNANNSFKKGNFLMIQVRNPDSDSSPHLRYERTPGCAGDENFISPYQFEAEPGEDSLVFQGREVLYAMTPGFINGADPQGSFADAFLVLNSADFEITSLNVEYEFSEYDHGGISSSTTTKK